MSNLSKQIATMRKLGFDTVEVVYGDKVLYVMEIDENPPHLTNGKSYLQLSPNQADKYLEVINFEVCQVLDRLKEEMLYNVDFEIIEAELAKLTGEQTKEGVSNG